MVHRYASGMIPFYGPAILRIVIGVVFAAHGAQKLFGLWGGAGLVGTAASLAELGLPYPYPLAVAIGVLEFAGGILLVVGALTLVVSFALILKLAGGIWKVHAAYGFFAANGGYEYHLVLIVALASLMLTGPGAFSFDGRQAESAAAEAAGRARLRAGKV